MNRREAISKNPYNEHAWILEGPEIGENCWIGAFTVIDGSGGLKIGKGCDIGSGSHIYTHSTVKRCLSERRLNLERKPVRIGNYVHIGANATILMGVKIGHHSVIGAGAVVPTDMSVPPYSMVLGVPAKIKFTGKEKIERFLKQQA